MFQKINTSHFTGRGPIQILYPGLAMQNTDTGIGTIGRIDHALFNDSTIIPMHPHVNDEILTYLRSGSAEHKDSEGFVENISKNKLMLMKAGRSFYHEEKVFGEAGTLEGLQIFIRPGSKDLNPSVTFLDLDEAYSMPKWRLLASPGSDTVFQFSSQTWIYDIKVEKGIELNLPLLDFESNTALLYVFSGVVNVNEQIALSKKEGLVMVKENPAIVPMQESEMVLFVTNEKTSSYDGGMYSGNQYQIK